MRKWKFYQKLRHLTGFQIKACCRHQGDNLVTNIQGIVNLWWVTYLSNCSENETLREDELGSSFNEEWTRRYITRIWRSPNLICLPVELQSGESWGFADGAFRIWWYRTDKTLASLQNMVRHKQAWRLILTSWYWHHDRSSSQLWSRR